MKPEAFGNLKFSGSNPLNEKNNCRVCQVNRWAWSYRVLQFLVWVRRPNSFFSSFFLQKLEEPFWFLGCLINKKKYSNVAAWQSFLWEFSRFSLPDWLTSTIGKLVKIQIHPRGGFNSGPSVDALRIFQATDWRSSAETCILQGVVKGMVLVKESFRGSLFPMRITQKMGRSEMIAANVGGNEVRWWVQGPCWWLRSSGKSPTAVGDFAFLAPQRVGPFIQCGGTGVCWRGWWVGYCNVIQSVQKFIIVSFRHQSN